MANPCPPGQHAGRGSNQYTTNCVPDEPGFAYSPRGTARPLSQGKARSPSPRLSMAQLPRAVSLSTQRYYYLGETGQCPPGQEHWGNEYASHCIRAHEGYTPKVGTPTGWAYQPLGPGAASERISCPPGDEVWGGGWTFHCVPTR